MKKSVIVKSITKFTVFAFCILLSMGVLTACGSNKKDLSSASTTEAISEDVAMDMAGGTTETAVMDTAASEEKYDEGVGELQNVGDINSTGKKLIKNVDMSVETKDFDNFIAVLKEKIKQVEGYIESSDISGGGYQYSSYRYGYIQARIPSDKLESFVSEIGSKANVTRTSERTTDVTLQYVDTASHIKALKTEQDALLRLLEEATKMADIMSIQSQLTQVRYELESYESQIRSFDNQVDYSTVNIDISEVERETSAEKLSFVEEIKTRFSNNMYNIKEDLRNFTISFISSIPYLIIWGAVIIVIILIGKKIYKKHKIKKNSPSESIIEHKKEEGEKK